MSSRKSSLLIQDMLRAIDHITMFTENISYLEFSKNFMIIEACLYNIQVIGEAVSKLSDDIKANETEIPWSLIKGMRNRLIHEYFGTDLPLVWTVIAKELPDMQETLQRISRDLMLKGD